MENIALQGNYRTLLSVVIPCYKSADFIAKTVQDIVAELETQSIFNYQIILVNDNPPDSTYNEIRRICESNKNIFGMTLTKNFGKAKAMLAGITLADGEFLIFADDDGQHPASGIVPLILKLYDGYDVCFAEFQDKKHSLVTTIGSKLNNKFSQYLYNLPKDIKTSAFFAINKIVANELLNYSALHVAFVPYILSVTKNVINIKLPHRESYSAKSRFTFKRRVSQALGNWFNFSDKPLKLVTMFGIIASIIGILFGIFIVCRKLFFPAMILPGYSSLISVQLFSSGLIFLSLGLIGRTIINIYSQAIKIPQYVVKETCGNIVSGSN